MDHYYQRLHNLFLLRYDNENPPEPKTEDDDEDSEDEPAPSTEKKQKTLPQPDIDKIVEKRTAKARRQAKDAMERLEALQQQLNLEGEAKEQLEAQIEAFRKQAFTAEELAKREVKRAREEYEGKLTKAAESAQTWETMYKGLLVEHEISAAAQKHGVLPEGVPFLAAFLRPQIKLVAVSSDTGKVTGHTTSVDFNDVGADGKPTTITFDVNGTVKRMKELPEQYGHLFDAGTRGGVGGGSGKPGSKGGYRPGMTPEEYYRLRKENPQALYGPGGVPTV